MPTILSKKKKKNPSKGAPDEYHHYWCDFCEIKFAGVYDKCPDCGGKIYIDEPIIRTPKPAPTNPLTSHFDTIGQSFDKLCFLTNEKNGSKCKYWNPESFGYDQMDKEAPLDKFFPEKIKEILLSSNQKTLEMLREMIESLGCKPHECIGEDCNCLIYKRGYADALSDILSIINEAIRK